MLSDLKPWAFHIETGITIQNSGGSGMHILTDRCGGEYVFDPVDGALIRISPPGRPDISALLGPAESGMHHPPRYWGKGFVITHRGAARWHHPVYDKNGKINPMHLVYDLKRVGLTLLVERTLTDTGLEETYTITNTDEDAVRVGSLGISIPFRDMYPSAEECLRSAYHAHVWTGGANAWVWAEPMNGREMGLGLDLLEGELWSYSVENRDHFSSSNLRGHLYLQWTDHARNPKAFGGQPELSLPAKSSLRWRWRLAWYDHFSQFEKVRAARNFAPKKLSAQVGETLILDETLHVHGSRAGIQWVEKHAESGTSRVAVLFHRSIREIVETRIDFILKHQQAYLGEPTREGAFLPYDRDTGLMEIGGAWGDWSDGRERVAMPLLLQHAVQMGWTRPRMEEAIEKFRTYAATFLVTEEYTVRGGSYEQSTKRLYNYPWMSEFFRNEYHRTGRVEDLQKAADILRAYYTHGGKEFLGFLYGVDAFVKTLEDVGETQRAEELRDNFIAQARHFRERGVDLPNHEVNYEQSIVAPLALLLLTAQKLLPDEDWRDAIRQTLEWLAAFAGKQPDARLMDIPIRHWDGFWFGRYRLWGDVFPHYWSVLSAAGWMEAAALYPDLKEELETRAEHIFRANLVHFEDDGFASCAFVYPSCVNGVPAHCSDPLANDQDWALVWLLRYAKNLIGIL